MSTSEMIDIYLLTVGCENMHFREMSTYRNVKEQTLNEYMPIWGN